jgi:regulator of protease activity HflC (stomatin/prohibitin superfamily)
MWYRIFDPKKAMLEVRSVDNAVIQVALTTLRTGIGQYTLDDVLKEQETVSTTIGQKIDAVTEPWGVKVERVEMKNVEIPTSMQRAIAQEADALREKRARLIKAEAELEASEQLRRASEIIMQNPAGLELRRMQMLTEVGAEQSSMTIIMMPSEFVTMARAIAQAEQPAVRSHASVATRKVGRLARRPTISLPRCSRHVPDGHSRTRRERTVAS